MAPVAVFYQACPVCGRSIRMPVQCFGRQVTCVHCGGEFRAEEQMKDATVAHAGLPSPTAAMAASTVLPPTGRIR